LLWRWRWLQYFKRITMENSISGKCIICNDTGIINKGTSVQEDCFKCKPESWEKDLKDFLEHITWIDTEDGKKETTKLLIELVRREMKEQKAKIMKSWKWKLFSFAYFMGWVKWYEYDFVNKKWLKQWFWQK
jgi:hypothetical protein